jgi:hypothetical protein
MKKQKEDKLFSKEAAVLQQYKEVLANDSSPTVSREHLEDLTNKYSNLLEQSRFLTWISGRLERKLQKANQDMFSKNHKLQTTLDELVKAKAGRNAYAIIYFIAIVLFVLEEFFVEPVIDMFGNGVGYSILIKLVIVLLLKVSEGFIEEKITKKPKLEDPTPSKAYE